MADLDDPLFKAIDNGDSKLVKELLDKGASVDSFTQESTLTTPLTLATDRNRPDIVQQLITRGANVNNYDQEGFSALHKVKSVEVESILLKAGAKVNQESQYGNPLDCVIQDAARYTSIGTPGQGQALALQPDPAEYAQNQIDQRFKVIKSLIKHGAKSDELGEGSMVPFYSKSLNRFSTFPDELKKILEIPSEVGNYLKTPNLTKIKEASEDSLTGELFKANFQKRAQAELTTAALGEFVIQRLSHPTAINDFIQQIEKEIVIPKINKILASDKTLTSSTPAKTQSPATSLTTQIKHFIRAIGRTKKRQVAKVNNKQSTVDELPSSPLTLLDIAQATRDKRVTSAGGKKFEDIRDIPQDIALNQRLNEIQDNMLKAGKDRLQKRINQGSKNLPNLPGHTKFILNKKNDPSTHR